MTAGRVTVNGEVATELGTKVDVDRDHIEVDGMSVKLNQGAVYLMLYKPTGYLTTMSDPQERACVADLVPATAFRDSSRWATGPRHHGPFALYYRRRPVAGSAAPQQARLQDLPGTRGRAADRPRSRPAPPWHRARRRPVPAGNLPRHHRTRGRGRSSPRHQARHHRRGGHHPRGAQEPGQAHAEQDSPSGDPPAPLQLCRP